MNNRVTPFRYAIPVIDRRGAGLGNELILWAKSFIAGQELGLHALHPAFGINKRRYWRYFGTSRTDYSVHRALRLSLPRLRFEEADYLKYGGEDYGDAIRAFASDRRLAQRSPLVLEVTGLWGGPGMLNGAREFIIGRLLSARWTINNLYFLERSVGQGRLRVGLHIRRGDFSSLPAGTSYSGRFNVTVPLTWYREIMRTIWESLGPDVVFVIASDASQVELETLTSAFPCFLTSKSDNTDVSDILALAGSDLLVCSISSYSLWAAFLGRMPYIWYRPQLTLFSGSLSIWGHLAPQQEGSSPVGHARAALAARPQSAAHDLPRGISVGMDGALPQALLEVLRDVQKAKPRYNDLIRYGVIWPSD